MPPARACAGREALAVDEPSALWRELDATGGVKLETGRLVPLARCCCGGSSCCFEGLVACFGGVTFARLAAGGADSMLTV